MTFVSTIDLRKPTNLIVVHSSATKLGVKPPDSRGLDPATAKSIYNAWMESAIIDNYGMVWILPKRLSEILRTSKGNARYISDKIEKQYKTRGAAGTYLHYAEINKQLSKIIINAGSISREKYAGFSESIGITIRDSAIAKLQRAESYAAMNAAKRKLKKQRIKRLSICHDELTGIPLLPTSEFSHIRSCAIYPQLTPFTWNGLIVNKNIHQTITDAYINDEDELYDLCRKQRWSTEWYEDYIRQLN